MINTNSTTYSMNTLIYRIHFSMHLYVIRVYTYIIHIKRFLRVTCFQLFYFQFVCNWDFYNILFNVINHISFFNIFQNLCRIMTIRNSKLFYSDEDEWWTQNYLDTVDVPCHQRLWIGFGWSAISRHKIANRVPIEYALYRWVLFRICCQ